MRAIVRQLAILLAATLVVVLAAPSVPAQAGGRYTGLAPEAFLRSWAVLGPIPISSGATPPDPAAQKEAFDQDLLLPCGGEAQLRLDPAPVCSIGGQEYRFSPVESEADVVDLAGKIGRKDYAVAYAMAEVESPATARVVLGLGSDDAVKVWLNGKLVHENWVQRAVDKDQDLVTLELQAGKNHLLLKIQNGEAAWGFAARAVSSKGLEGRIWRAARVGDVDRIQSSLAVGEGVRLDAKTRYGLTAWQIAKICGRVDAADLLASKGADTRLPIPKPETVVDAIFSDLVPGRSSGAAVLVSKDGKTVFEKGYGYASLEHGAKITPLTKFRIGSITKQFTAAAILRLQEQGKLELSDPLSKYIPDYPKGDVVTLRHLLTHTSGMHSYTDKPDFLQTAPVPVKTEELIQSFKNDPYDFEPGARWAYCNSGYFLLGYIVEKVSGQSYADFLKSQFFDPLGMKDTGVHTHDAILDNEATGYSQEGDSLKKALNWDMTRAGGAGALYSTVEDLARWNEAVFGGKVLSEATLEAAWTPVAVGSQQQPPEEGYGYGWFIDKFRGLPEVQHGGGLQGFASQLTRFPGERLTIVVLANALNPLPGLVPGELARNVAELYLSDKMESRAIPKAIALPPEALDSFVGRYDYGGLIMTITREGSQLFAQVVGQPKVEIFPKSENEFFWKVVEAQVRFVKDDAGRVVKAVHHQGPQTFDAPRVEEHTAIQLTLEALDAFVGKYDYGQGQVIATVTREGNHLYAQLTGQPRFEIFPSSENEFFWKAVEAKVTFIKDASGKVVKGIHEQGGRKLEVPKIE